MKIIKKHDKFARKCLTDLSMAREFLQTYLPAEVKDKCNLDKLNIVSGSYVEDDLKAHISDVVYQLDLNNNNGSAYIYVLLEHQSTPLENMPYRILRYQLTIIQKHIEEHPKEKIPLVVPLVFYNGSDTPYPYSTQLADLFADRELFNSVGLGNFKLADLTVIEDDEILQHKKLAFLEILLKHIHDKNFNAIIDYIIKAFKLAELHDTNQSLIHSGIHYLLSGREREDVNQLIEHFKSEIPEYGDTIMTYAEELRYEGEQKGRQEGIQLGEQRGMQLGEQKGRLEGRQDTQLEIARNLLKSGVEQSLVATATNLTLEQLKSLN